MPVQFMEIRDRGGKFRFREEEELGFFNFLSFEVLALKTKGTWAWNSERSVLYLENSRH